MGFRARAFGAQSGVFRGLAGLFEAHRLYGFFFSALPCFVFRGLGFFNIILNITSYQLNIRPCRYGGPGCWRCNEV